MASHTIDIWIYPSQDSVVISEMGQSGAPNRLYQITRINLVGGSIRECFEERDGGGRDRLSR
jgi:hypothetical protein